MRIATKSIGYARLKQVVVGALSALALVPLTGQARPGDVDTSFGTGGRAYQNNMLGQDYVPPIVLSPSGKILTGTFKAIPVGQPAGTDNQVYMGLFPASGSATPLSTATQNYPDPGVFTAYAVQSDGKVLVAEPGYDAAVDGVPGYYKLARYTQDTSTGVLTADTTFGGGTGRVTTQLTNDSPVAVAIQADGKIVLAGSVPVPTGVAGKLLRYHSDGALDTGFGIGGGYNTTELYRPGLIIQTDGKILVYGATAVDEVLPDLSTRTVYQAKLARHLSSGLYDTNFGDLGTVDVGLFQGTVGAPVALQSDGKIVVGGAVAVVDIFRTTPYTPAEALDYGFALKRYNTDGSADNSFGVGGLVKTSVSHYSPPIPGNEKYHEFFAGSVTSIAIQANGKIVVAGDASNVAGLRASMLLRYSTSGAVDLNFGMNGMVVPDFNNYTPADPAISLQSDGKIVMAGYYEGADFGGGIPEGAGFMVSRYQGDSTQAGDVAIHMTSSPKPVSDLEGVKYHITVTNGNAAVSNVTVTDTLPAGLVFASAVPSQGTCSGTTTISCALGNMAANSFATVVISLNPHAAGTFINTATLTATGDTTPSNNTASETTVIYGSVDLIVSNVTPLGTVSIPAGGVLGASITTTNVGAGPSYFTASGEQLYIAADFYLVPSSPTLAPINLGRRAAVLCEAADPFNLNPSASCTLDYMGDGTGVSGGPGVQIPGNTPPGVYTLRVMTDSNQVQPENNAAGNAESNNSFDLSGAITVTAAIDLVMDGANLSDNIPYVPFPVNARQAGMGMTYNVTDKVKNQGAVKAGAFKVNYYLATAPSVNPLSLSGALLLGTRSVTGLLPGVTETPKTTPLLISSKVIYTTGVYYIVAVIDPATATAANGTALEGDETNNVLASFPLKLKRDQDVKVITLNLGATSVGIGETVNISDELSNLGTTPTLAAAPIKFYLSTDAVLNTAKTATSPADISIGTRTAAVGLAGGGTNPGTTVAKIPLTVPMTTSLSIPDSAGFTSADYYVIAVVDLATTAAKSQGALFESNEGTDLAANNLLNTTIATAQLTVRRDIDAVPLRASAVNAVGVPVSTVDVGGIFYIDDAVQNQGTTLPTKAIPVTYYLSTDTTFNALKTLTSPADIKLGTRSITGLLSGACSGNGDPIAVTCTKLTALPKATVPFTTAPGNYYLFAVSAAAFDTDTTNDVLPFGTLTVHSNQDFVVTSATPATTTWIKGSTTNTVNVSVQNQGTTPNTAAVKVAFYLSADTVFDPVGKIAACTATVASAANKIAGGASASLLTPLTTCKAPATSGTYKLFAVVDAWTALLPNGTLLEGDSALVPFPNPAKEGQANVYVYTAADIIVP